MNRMKVRRKSGKEELGLGDGRGRAGSGGEYNWSGGD